MLKVLLGSAALCAASAASAAVPINFNSAPGNLGNSHTYTASGLSVTATGYSAAGVQTALYGKNGSGDEKGLGLVADPSGDFEIYYPGNDFIQLDVHNLFGLVSGASFFMGSSTSGEQWKVYGSNSIGQLGSLLLTDSDEGLHALSNWTQYNYYDFVAAGTVNQLGYRSAGNVLLGGLSLTRAPEPATWAMMMLGFGAIGFTLRGQRRREAVQL